MRCWRVDRPLYVGTVSLLTLDCVLRRYKKKKEKKVIFNTTSILHRKRLIWSTVRKAGQVFAPAIWGSSLNRSHPNMSVPTKKKSENTIRRDRAGQGGAGRGWAGQGGMRRAGAVPDPTPSVNLFERARDKRLHCKTIL